MGIGAGVGDIHRTQDVEVGIKLLERVVIIVITHTTHAFNLCSCGKGEALVIMTIDHFIIEVVRLVIPGNIISILTVRVVDQNNQAAELAVVHVATVTDATQQVVAVIQHRLATLYHGFTLQA